MCGRFTVRTPSSEVARIFRTAGTPPPAKPRFNVTPSQDVLGVRFNPQDGLRHLDPLHWGLVPIWAKDTSIGNKLTNARAESVAEKPSFRDAFAKRRCIIPADGFYEWQRREGAKQPFAIVPRSAGDAASNQPPLFAFAGLWERWKYPATGEILRSFAIITTSPNEVMAPIHDRMPVILDAADWGRWLGEETASQADLLGLLKPAPADIMRAYPISSRVNSPKFDDESLLTPL